MVKNLLKVTHVLEGLQQAEHLRMLNIYGLQSTTDSVRTRSWSGDSKNYCAWDFDAGSWHETRHGKIHSAASATRAEGTLCCSYYWLDSNHYQWTRFPPEARNWRWIMGLWLWSGNKGPVDLKEVAWFSKPGEGTAKSQDQDHVNCVFWLGRCTLLQAKQLIRVLPCSSLVERYNMMKIAAAMDN